MPPVPAFKDLLISRPPSGRPALARLRGVSIALGIYAAALVALVLAPVLLLEMMDPPRAGLSPDIAVVFPPHPGQGGSSQPGRIRHGVKAPHGTRGPSNRPEAPPRPAPQPRSTLAPPPPGEETGDSGSRDGIGPAGPLGDPDGAGKDPAGTPEGCPGCSGDRRPGPAGPDEPYDALTPGLTAPSLVPGTRALPQYPDPARRAGLQGTVILLVVIESDGTVGTIEVVRSPDQRWGFDLAAIDAVKRWRYQPALLGGRPVSATIQVMVEFSIAR